MADVDLLAELIRIPSITPDADGEGAVAEVLRARLDRAGLDTTIERSPDGRPNLVARLAGPTDRPALVLLSHTDTVPVEEDAWRHDPFGGEVVDGELWGRGAVDMKGVAVLHADAVAALADSGATPTREVVVVAVADEEAGGAQGAEWLVRERGEIVGFRDGAPPPEVVGEGGFGLSGILDRPIMPLVLGKKGPLGVRARATGTPGHGSMPPEDQAIRALARFVEDVAGPRPAHLHPVMREQFAILAESAGGVEARLFAALAGPVGPAVLRLVAGQLRRRGGAMANLVADTVTPTRLDAGYAFNVVPGEATATFDCRLLPDTDPDDVLAWLRGVGRDAGVQVDEIHRWSSPVSRRTELVDAAAEVSAGLPTAPIVVPSLTPGTTDLRWFRARGATGLGWVPLVLSPEQLAGFHGHDERVPVEELHRAQQAMDDLVARACT